MAMKIKVASTENGRRSHPHSGWKDELQSVINEQASRPVRGRVASPREIAITADALFRAFRTLHKELGMKPSPHNIKEKHVRHLVHHWYRIEKKPVDIINADLIALRTLALWVGKPGFLADLDVFVAAVVAGCHESSDAEPLGK